MTDKTMVLEALRALKSERRWEIRDLASPIQRGTALATFEHNLDLMFAKIIAYREVSLALEAAERDAQET